MQLCNYTLLSIFCFRLGILFHLDILALTLYELLLYLYILLLIVLCRTLLRANLVCCTLGLTLFAWLLFRFWLNNFNSFLKILGLD